jgi:hypothetical protein
VATNIALEPQPTIPIQHHPNPSGITIFYLAMEDFNIENSKYYYLHEVNQWSTIIKSLVSPTSSFTHEHDNGKY